MQPRKKYKSEVQTDPVELMAWAPGTQGIPTTLHVPYWARKCAPGVVERTMVETLLSASETSLRLGTFRSAVLSYVVTSGSSGLICSPP